MSNKLAKNKSKANGTIDMNLNLYEYNKKGMDVYSPIDKEVLKERCKKINEDKDDLSYYYMLYNKESSDFTIFCIDDSGESSQYENFSDVLYECLENRGDVIDITNVVDQKGVFEIWIRRNKENFVYYLYPYDTAVITVKEG